MKIKSAICSLLVLAGFAASAQEVVTTSGGTKDVFYSLANGEVSAVSSTNWDIAFEIKGFTGAIYTNDGAGVELYQSPYTVAQWSSVDTNGMSGWSVRRNDHEMWSAGAFNENVSSDFDLGWGEYDINTHAVKGDSIYVLKLADGSFVKMYVKDLTSGTYTFVYANIDGSNEQTKTLAGTNFTNKNFGYFSFSTGSTLDREPAKADWDLLFTKYQSPIPVGGGQFLYYPVSGVKVNKNMEVAERAGVDVTNNDTSTLAWSISVIEIGSDWKQFDGSTYVLTDNLSFFIRTASGSVWKIYFTKYEGGSAGTYTFQKELIASSGIESISLQDVAVYPNPSTASQGFVLESTNPIENAQLIDANGKVVPTALNNNALDLNGVAAGMYILQIQTANGLSNYCVVVR